MHIFSQRNHFYITFWSIKLTFPRTFSKFQAFTVTLLFVIINTAPSELDKLQSDVTHTSTDCVPPGRWEANSEGISFSLPTLHAVLWRLLLDRWATSNQMGFLLLTTNSSFHIIVAFKTVLGKMWFKALPACKALPALPY